MKTVELAGGLKLSALGQGTWHMGDDSERRTTEIEALRTGIELGMTTIDTAEMYGSGRSETLVGEAIGPHRDKVQLVSKVLPSNASRKGTIEACEASLRRLKTDRIDLYLLHWQGSHPLRETIDAFETLKEQGKVGDWGLSNFDRRDIESGLSVDGAERPAANQVYYSLEERGIDFDLKAWMGEKGIVLMAYTPFGASGELLNQPVLQEIAVRHGAKPAQIALAFLLRQPNLCAIPKASSPDHVRENAGAAEIELTSDDLDALDGAFPPPQSKRSLAII